MNAGLTSRSTPVAPVPSITHGSPHPIDEHPDVAELLADLALGAIDPVTMKSPVGRNVSWIGSTTTGRHVFIKKLTGPVDSVAERMQRITDYERHSAAVDIEGYDSPLMLGCDVERGVVVFEGIDDAESFAAQALGGSKDFATSFQIGSGIGSLHSSPVADPSAFDRSIPALPATDYLEAVSLTAFCHSTWGELALTRMHQADSEFIAAVFALRDRERDAPRVASHCDFRLDQILVRRGRPIVIDWEEFRLADPARDIGSYAGEWVYRAILGIVNPDADHWDMDATLSHEMILERGIERLTELQPHIAEFWRGYLTYVPDADAELAARATAFAGWHLHDRLLVSSQYRASLPAIERAAAGIGRGMLLTPEAFSSVIGLEASVHA